jgi:hypothetical protein
LQVWSKRVRVPRFELGISQPQCEVLTTILHTPGEAGYRSQYLSHAKRALYHLSYIPTESSLTHHQQQTKPHAQHTQHTHHAPTPTPKSTNALPTHSTLTHEARSCDAAHENKDTRQQQPCTRANSPPYRPNKTKRAAGEPAEPPVSMWKWLATSTLRLRWDRAVILARRARLCEDFNGDCSARWCNQPRVVADSGVR